MPTKSSTSGVSSAKSSSNSNSRLNDYGRLSKSGIKIVSYGGKRYRIADSKDYRGEGFFSGWRGLAFSVGLFLLIIAAVSALRVWATGTDATKRAWDDVLALLADNTSGGISPEDLRDAIVTVVQKDEYEFTGPVSEGGSVTAPSEYLGSDDGMSTTELWVDGFRWYRSDTAARGYVESGTDAITVNTAVPDGAECLFRYYEK